MRKFYEEKEILFAVLWIIAYCVILAPVLDAYGDGSLIHLIVLAVFALAIFAFVKTNHLEAKYGIDRWPHPTRPYLYFIPMWILSTGNLWGGIRMNYSGMSVVYAVVSMFLVGFAEEMIFRGFLFQGMLADGNKTLAIVIVSLTFGIGHIINLFTGQTTLETFVQVPFAIAWGFIFTMVAYKSKSLLPCILAHGLVDACCVFTASNPIADWIYVISTIVVSVVYCMHLSRLKENGPNTDPLP